MPAAAAAALTGSLLLLIALRNSGLYGDEYTYTAGAKALADYVAGRSHNLAKLEDAIFGTGWFMPGMYALGLPLYLVEADPVFWQIRAWSLAVNALLLIALYTRLVPVVGRPFARLLIIFPGLAPLWHIGAQSFLPDLPAGLVNAIGLTIAYQIALAMHEGRVPSWRGVLALSACFAASIYLRGPTLLLALATFGLLILFAAVMPAPRWRAVLRLASGLGILFACLAPWSLASTRYFGEPVVTTTNVPLVLADSFGSPAKTCFGPCAQGDDIWPAWHFSQSVASRTGKNPLAVQREMMRASLEGLTPRRYLAEVRSHFEPFLFDPGSYLRTTLHLRYSLPVHARDEIYILMNGLTWLLYAPFMAALWAIIFVPIRRLDTLRLQALLLKVAAISLFMQPFLHKSSGRYWIALAPLATWAAAVLWKNFRAKPPASVGQPPPCTQWLDRLQAVIGVALAMLTALILLA